MTAFTRPTSASTFPSSPLITIKKVDFTSLDEVTAAFKGLDAVVSALGTESKDEQKIVLEAVIAARVPRFIPSEFGMDNSGASAPTRFDKFNAAKFETLGKLKELQKEHNWFSWTGLATGLFFDWVGHHNDRPA